MFSKKVRNQKGFTLVELIIVIAIVGVLAAIAVPRFDGFKESVAKKADEATMVVIENAAKVYYLNQETPPQSITIQNLKNNDLLDGDKDYVPQAKNKTSFKITVINDGNIKVESE